MTVRIHIGDCREVMAGMEPESIDAIVTDAVDHIAADSLPPPRESIKA